MADLEITTEEIKGIDVNTIASMQLKDGTTIVINQGEVAQAEGEFVEEQAQEGEMEQVEENYECQENQLRARPIPGRMGPAVAPRPLIAPVPVRPIKPVVAPVPVRPAVVPVKPVVRPPGPPMRPHPHVGAPVFRARPGMPVARPPVVPVPVHKPVMAPKVVPVPMKPAVMPHPPKMVPMKPAVVPMKPAVVPVTKPHVPGIARPMPVPVKPVFRARPNIEQEEEPEEYDYQEEEVAGEEQYCECEGEEYQDEQFRARPMMMVPPRPPMMPRGPVPKVVPVPVMPPKRGPMVGYNTFQPRVFRARPRHMMPPPMTTFTPMAYGRPGMHHPRGPMVAPMMPMVKPVFRGKERSNSYDAQEEQYDECCENQCTKSVCTRCGKEF